MCKTLSTAIIIYLLLPGNPVRAQGRDTLPPAAKSKPALYKKDDTSSIAAVINATYEVISGEAGPRDWGRFHQLFLPDARMGASQKNRAGQTVFRSFTPQDYEKNNQPYFTKSGFFEEALATHTTQFGNIAHVQSAYQYRLTKGGRIEQRGVNYFTLVKSGGRWWIANLVWQDEDTENVLTKEILKR